MEPIITVRKDVLGGTPCFAGTRVPAESLFDALSHGRTIDYFLEQFPSVSRQQAEALLAQARQRILAEANSIAAA